MQLDPVAKRLIELGDDQAVRVLAWLDADQQRRALSRRALLCTLGGWLLVCFAAAVGAVIAWIFAKNALDLVAMVGTPKPTLIFALPTVLLVIAILIVVGGFVLMIRGQFPGLQRAQSAIDWAGICEAMSRLLAAGSTYPDAFITASKVAKTKRNQRWLQAAAERVRRGGPDIGTTHQASGDITVVELLLESAGDEASERWRIASDHFVHVSQNRLSLLLGSVPIIATLVSGAFLWIAVAGTLGWMWRSAAQLINGLS